MYVISHCENLQIDDDDVHFNLATDFCVFTFAYIYAHKENHRTSNRAHWNIASNKICKMFRKKYLLYWYSPLLCNNLIKKMTYLYGNIKATADLPCLACVMILFWGGKTWKIQHFLHFLEIFCYSVCVSSAHWADCSN